MPAEEQCTIVMSVAKAAVGAAAEEALRGESRRSYRRAVKKDAKSILQAHPQNCGRKIHLSAAGFFF